MRVISDAGNLSGKKVLLRVDFNVAIDKAGEIMDDFRIRAALPTIKYLLKNQAKIILMSHFGRPNGKKDGSMSLVSVAQKLSEYLNTKIKKADDCIGVQVEGLVASLNNGEIIFLENLRFCEGEEANDQEFSKKLAALGEIYVNDAFGVSHRAHASIVGIPKFLPSFAGFLLEKEVKILSQVLENPSRPLSVVIGGAKISTKIKLIEEYLKKADNVILGGALANTVLHAKGLAIGKSMFEKEAIAGVEKLEITDNKLHIPVDTIVSEDRTGKGENRIAPVGKISENELILDIGPETEKIFSAVIEESKMVVWNGPMGLFEVNEFAHGTEAMAKSIAQSNAFSIVGGGETTCFIENLGLIDKFSHVSTGGGAMMEFLAGDELPGIDALSNGK
ncbi:MAG: phosphoglycerate kinase [Candidatus Portnoybacteria bacterium]|nr:phosphoglycerate kinase [Candidatus Portnoybacteria bacterium]